MVTEGQPLGSPQCPREQGWLKKPFPCSPDPTWGVQVPNLPTALTPTWSFPPGEKPDHPLPNARLNSAPLQGRDHWGPVWVPGDPHLGSHSRLISFCFLILSHTWWYSSDTGCQGSTRVGCMKGKCPAHCTIYPVPFIKIINYYY